MINSVSTVQAQSPFNQFKSIRQMPIKMDADRFESLNSSEKPAKKSKWKKILTRVAIAAGTLGLVLLTKGKFKKSLISPAMIKEIEELVSSGKVKQETVDMLMGLIKDSKKNSLKDSYEAIINYMGIKVAPELKPLAEGRGIGGVYHPNLGDIRLPENADLGTILHELTHFNQFQKVYRAFGKDAMVEAQVEKLVNALKQNPKYAEKELGKPFKDATKEEIEMFMEKERNRMNSEFNEGFYKRVAEANGELSSKELEEAKKYLEAMKNPNHNHSIIEREAYSKEISFENELREILKIIKPKK